MKEICKNKQTDKNTGKKSSNYTKLKTENIFFRMILLNALLSTDVKFIIM